MKNLNQTSTEYNYSPLYTESSKNKWDNTNLKAHQMKN